MEFDHNLCLNKGLVVAGGVAMTIGTALLLSDIVDVATLNTSNLSQNLLSAGIALTGGGKLIHDGFTRIKKLNQGKYDSSFAAAFERKQNNFGERKTTGIIDGQFRELDPNQPSELESPAQE